MPLSVDDKFGPYEILFLLGTGGVRCIVDETKLKRDLAIYDGRTV